MSGALLAVTDLERHFEGLAAVDRVSFSVAPHEVVSIIGPNGSGKTTTLNLVTGAIPAHGGTITLGLPTVIVQEGGYLCDALGDNLTAFLTGFGGKHRVG